MLAARKDEHNTSKNNLFNLIVVGVYTLNLHHYELKTTYPRRVEVPLLKVLGRIVTQVHK